MVVVVGTFRGGTSCTAGVLSQLGYHFGDRLKPTNRFNPTGFWEDKQLAGICRRAIREPHLYMTNNYQHLVRDLSEWRNKHEEIDAIKHPSLSFMIPQLEEVFTTVKFVWVHRSIEESARSLLKCGWWPRAPRLKLLEKMDRVISQTLLPQRTNWIRVEFYDLLSEPHRQIDRIKGFLEIDPTTKQLFDAANFIDRTQGKVQCILSGNTGRVESQTG